MTKRKQLIRTIWIVLACLIVVGSGLGVYAFVSMRAVWDNPDQALKQDTTNAKYEGYDFKEETINLVLFGLDFEESRQTIVKGVRPDTIVIMAINTKTLSVQCINIQRDTYCTVDRLAASGQVASTTKDRVNSAMVGIGRNKYGYRNTLNALEGIFRDVGVTVPLTYYAGVDINAIGPIADAVGGVEVKLDVSIPNIGKEGRTVNLKGDVAEAYVRARKGYATLDNSDTSRVKRQQDFFIGLAKRLKQMGPLDALPGLWDKLGASVDTNLTMNQLLALASLLSKVDLDNVSFTIPAAKTIEVKTALMLELYPDKLSELALSIWYQDADGIPDDGQLNPSPIIESTEPQDSPQPTGAAEPPIDD